MVIEIRTVVAHGDWQLSRKGHQGTFWGHGKVLYCIFATTCQIVHLTLLGFPVCKFYLNNNKKKIECPLGFSLWFPLWLHMF